MKLGMPLEQISRGIGKIKPVEHRLQLTAHPGGLSVIDDAFNSNIQGAKQAFQVLGQFPQKRIVVTHHVPTAQAVSERYRGSALESAFVAELGEWIAGSGADMWIFGHSHANMNVRIGTMDIVCNQLGSTVKRMASGWRPDAVIEI